MATAVKGDRSSKEHMVSLALDQAFFDRISRCFDSWCDTYEGEFAPTLFLDRFKVATNCWNQAHLAIQAEYPAGLAATQLPADE